MAKPYRFQRKKKLDSLFKGYTDIAEEWRPEWCKYLCVRLYGYLERTFVEIIEEYSDRKACGEVSQYVSRRLNRLNSATPENCISIVRDFKSKWADDLEKFISDSEMKDHIASVTSNRHLIAHGNDVGLTYSRLQNYQKSVEAFLDEVQRKFN